MLSHLFGQSTHANAGKVVDGKANVPGVFLREHALEARPQNLVFHALLKLWHSNLLGQILEEDLDKDSAA